MPVPLSLESIVMQFVRTVGLRSTAMAAALALAPAFTAALSAQTYPSGYDPRNGLKTGL